MGSMVRKAARIAVLGWGLVGATGVAAPGCGAPSGLDACEPVNGSQATVGLEDFCQDLSCPPTPEAAVAASCAAGHHVIVRTGCGLVEVGTFGFAGTNYVYSGGALVGANHYSDVPHGPCNVYNYVAGVVAPPCPSAAECLACGSDQGAAGADGSGGETSGAGGAGQGEGVTSCE